MLTMFGVGVALLYAARTATFGRRWVTAALLAYWTLATPPFAWLLAVPLARTQSAVGTPADAHGAQAVVVLGGGIISTTTDGLTVDDLGNSAVRVIEGVRVWRLLGHPLLVMSGGNAQ